MYIRLGSIIHAWWYMQAQSASACLLLRWTKLVETSHIQKSASRPSNSEIRIQANFKKLAVTKLETTHPFAFCVQKYHMHASRPQKETHRGERSKAASSLSDRTCRNNRCVFRTASAWKLWRVGLLPATCLSLGELATLPNCSLRRLSILCSGRRSDGGATDIGG
jgi:hypothetical protein